MKRIYVVGTGDTKAEELRFLADRIRALGGAPLLVDVGTMSDSAGFDIFPHEVAKHAPQEAAALASGDRGRAVSAMAAAFAAFLPSRTDIAGVVGIGGGGGTAIVTAGMRELPIGLPKLMVSTLAASDVSAFVGVSDIAMIPAVTDLAGLNRISRTVLSNAAQAICAMAANPPEATDDRPAIGLTMFGVTTPCVTAVAEKLRERWDCLIFHATGTGGRTMEKLAGSSMLDGVIDVTTTEIADLIVGGVLAAGQDRLDVIARKKLPFVGSVGALDMVNFWAPETIPERFRDRKFHRHNPNVTLMRTTAEECRRIGAFIAKKLNACDGPVRFLIPDKGVSALDIDGGAFFDAEADSALFSAIEDGVTWTAARRLQRLPLHINDPQFAAAVIAAWREIAP
jgi:uncharacterized protein (UPF0261 family)